MDLVITRLSAVRRIGKDTLGLGYVMARIVLMDTCLKHLAMILMKLRYREVIGLYVRGVIRMVIRGQGCPWDHTSTMTKRNCLGIPSL